MTGDTVFISMNNHYISTFTINMKYSIVNFDNIKSTSKNVYLQTGIYSEILPLSQSILNVTAS